MYECFLLLDREFDRSRAMGTVALIISLSMASSTLIDSETGFIRGKSYNSSGDLGDESLWLCV